MPFTPLHMGPGILVKALLQGSFSLMVFGWCQIVMDLQPLFAIVSGEGQLHGFSHTYIGSTVIALFSAVTGKYLSQIALVVFSNGAVRVINIQWWVAIVSAFIGAYSHVILDSIMHADVRPLLPFSDANALQGLISVAALYRLCLYTALVGAGLYFVIRCLVTRHNKGLQTDGSAMVRRD